MKKFVIFDIDGTLIRALRPIDNLQRFRYSIQKAFDVDVGKMTHEVWKRGNYNGKGDRFILWNMLSHHGVSRDTFLDRLGEIGEYFAAYLDIVRADGPSYEVIEDAKKLLEKVISARHLSEGVLTGNLGPSARWKLKDAGLPEFAFGVYGHEADSREDLARLIIPKAKKFFGRDIIPSDITIIGDTVNDVLCARAIGATVIIVSTGWNVHKDEFADHLPDLHVDSLLDERVLSL